ncbi:snf2 family helicase [Ophiostoma piceae UAMH 11346]|uniref:Snf2 family helicase n=1 Tax=Ophiostoma piceae (strain UAMH 11346) TaxID=1262450 RepID=S3BUU4_OPHP1|nr:snf2 family helicase [Ophiostoma piceae UAMH 11346]
MARARSESFSDDDLMIVSSQAMSSQGYNSQELGGDPMSSPLQPTPRRPNDVIDITDSPVAPALSPSKNAPNRTAQPTTSRPMFGHATQMTVPGSPAPVMSSSAAAAVAQQRKQPQSQNSMFNNNRNRPEHHRPQRLTGPLAPKPADRKAAPRPLFSSVTSSQADGGTAYPLSSFYNNSKPNQTIMNTKPIASAASHGDIDFYVDPDKAAADLKALLEGGMEDDDDEEEEAAPAPATGAAAAAPGQDKPPPKAAKAKKAGDDFVTEDGTVESIKVRLLPHQVEGVKWMRGRELGPVKRGRVPKGGILADDMGLGKTLQSLALIVTNPKPSKDSPAWKKHYERIDGATLVVAPLALIRQWEAEIKEKVSSDKPLKVCVHHGPQRSVRPKELAQYDVVITTYQILVSEHGHSNDSLKSGCFGLNWYRVILDEAHSIKNRNAKMTKACCALSSEFRWCLTGTPMQNNLDELQSLIKFLRITPYDNLTEWRAHIDAPLKNGRGYLAIRRLHSLLRCFMKRRTKDVLKEEGALVPGGKKAMEAAAAAAKEEASSGIASSAAKGPEAPNFKITERNVVSVSTEFSPAERKFYDRLEDRADKSLEKMMQGKAVSYANALVLLLRLRQACNHPNLLNLKLDKDKDALTTDAPPPKSATTDGDIDALADVFGGLGIQAKKCEVCMSDLTKDEQRACEDAGGDMVCTSCVEDRDILMDSPAKAKKEKVKRDKSKKSKRSKKSKKDESKLAARKTIVDDDDDDDDSVLPARRRPIQRKPRNRRAIIDSDDEDEEANGSWLVGEEGRGSLRLGKAGGSEDEDAEGGGDWINSDDSIHHSENESDNASRLSSFVVDDEKKAKSRSKKEKRTNVFGESETDSAGSATESGSDDSESGSGEDSDEDSEDSDSDDGSANDSRISEADFFANIDDGSFLGGGQRKSRRERLSTAHSRNVLVSAKIRKMMSLLKEEAAEHKFIVFSQFTSMLDLVSPFLLQAGLGHVRYDGGMRNDAREASLHSLRNDPSTRVLLCSLKCGALGLNLTAATRVVILEPFWNPFVEEQAIDRVHRLTQTVDVTVYKLTVADTVEQRILELQEKKRLLASQALEGGLAKGKGKKEGLKLGLKELMDLFKHDSRGGGDGDGDDVGTAHGSGSADPNGIDEQLARFEKGVLRRPSPRARSSQSTRQQTPTDPVYSRRW